MKKFDLRQFVLLLVPLLLILGVALLFLYSTHAGNSRTLISQKARNNVRLADIMLSHELGTVISDLQFLAEMHEASAFLDREQREDEVRSLVLFAEKKKVYDQIRYLDITGMEMFRVNYNAGAPSAAPLDSLQFKGGRYYTAEGLKLMKEDVYISPFDLNKERGQIERPLKPMIRFVTPVFDSQGNRRGLVILNYLGKKLLEVFDKVSNRGDDIMMLLNEAGYWLRCQDPANEWGFMFEDRKDRVFQARFASAWRTISGQKEGQFLDQAGLFTFSTLCLPDVIPKSTVLNPMHEAGCWKIVSQVPAAAFYASERAYAARLAMVGGPLALLLTAACAILVYLRSRSHRAEQSIIEQNTSFARFVPQEFLRLLGKGNLRDVDLTTNVQCEMTVLFSDIRSYSTLSEGMTSQEVLGLLNDYFGTVSKPISEHGGFIDNFIGDALMALFPQAPEDALHAAVSMRHGLRELNDRRREDGGVPVRSGVGLHFGDITLGTIGSHSRMQSTAIGDTVNLASRIESVTKAFKVDIVISDSVYHRLKNPDEFLLREIDTVRVKGKQEPVTLYECFNADPEDISKCKAATMATLRRGLTLYKAGDFDQALDAFTECAEACPEDSIPPIYITRCHTMKRISPGDGWAGISTL